MKPTIKRTKIVCTMGPATESIRMMVALGREGMDVARLNFSHGTYETHAKMISRLRTAGKQLERPFALLLDVEGPKIRVGNLPEAGITIKTGSEIVFTTDPNPRVGDIPVTLPNLHKDIKRRAQILLDDGLLECEVKRIDGHRIFVKVIVGGLLKSHKGLNLPGTSLKIPALSDKDKADALFGIQQGVDFIALSFVRSAQDVLDLRKIVDAHPKGKGIRIVGKIEKPEAVKNFDSILPHLDAVMVARGDLGIEMPAHEVPVIQKQLVAKCRQAGKPVIVATQMLDSMIRNPRATRAEISDVANAVVDHADAVMLSAETATGAYPLEAVRTMAKTIRSVESSPFDDLANVEIPANAEAPVLISAGARVMSDAINHAPIVVRTTSGYQALLISSYRPEVAIYAFTEDERVYRQMRLSWGVLPMLQKKSGKLTEIVKPIIAQLVKQKMMKKGQPCIVVGGSIPGTSKKPGSSARIQIVTL